MAHGVPHPSDGIVNLVELAGAEMIDWFSHQHLLHAQEYRREMTSRFSTWNEVTGLTTTA